MLSSVNRSRNKFYLANAVTLGLYGAFFVVFKAGPIGKKVGANLPSPGMGFLLTLLTLGIYPGIMLSVLAYQLAPNSYPLLGHLVLTLNFASLITAFFSGGLFIVLSIALWAHACWLVVNSANIVSTEAAPNPSFKRDA